jgi:hypothetical protein
MALPTVAAGSAPLDETALRQIVRGTVLQRLEPQDGLEIAIPMNPVTRGADGAVSLFVDESGDVGEVDEESF